MANHSHCEPVFFMARDLSFIDDNDRPCDALEICLAAETVCGREKILGAQEIRGLWRIYPISRSARTDLLVNGLSLRGRAITLCDKNPFILRGGNETPATKVWISDIPLSVANEDIESALIRVGCTLRSSLMMEKIRNRDGKLTRFYTGRRFVFISVPEKPLDKTINVGSFRGTFYHKEQPKRRRSTTMCSRCLEIGHWATECENDVTCRDCRKQGHKRGDPDCTAVERQEVQSVWGPPPSSVSTPSLQKDPEPVSKTINPPMASDSAKDTASETEDCGDSATDIPETDEPPSTAGKRRKSKSKKSPAERSRTLKKSGTRQATLGFQTRPRPLTPKRTRSRTGDSPTDSSLEKNRKLTTTDTENARDFTSPDNSGFK